MNRGISFIPFLYLLPLTFLLFKLSFCHHHLLVMLASKENFIKLLLKQVLTILIFAPQLSLSYVASPYFRAGSVSLNSIANLSGVQTKNFTVTYSQPLPTVPTSLNTSNKLVFGFKTFKTYDTLYNQSIRIVRTSTYHSLNTGFSINVTQKNNFTHIMKVQIFYLAIDYTLGYYVVAYDTVSQDMPKDTIFNSLSKMYQYFSNNSNLITNWNGSINNGEGMYGLNYQYCIDSAMKTSWNSVYTTLGNSSVIVIITLHSIGISTLTNQNTNLTQWVSPYNLTNLKFNFSTNQVFVRYDPTVTTGYPYLQKVYLSYYTSMSLFQFSYLLLHNNLTNPTLNPFQIQMTKQNIIINGGVERYISIPKVFHQNMFTALHDYGARYSNCRLDYQFEVISNSTFSGIHFLPSTTTGTLATCALNYLNQTLIIFQTLSCITPYLLYNTVTYDCVVNCTSYYFQNVSQNQCQPCYYACFSCTAANSSTSCASCSSLDNRTITNGSCVCNSEYFDNMYTSSCVSCLSVNSMCSGCTVNLSSLSPSSIVALFSNSNWTTIILPYYTCTQCVSPYFYDSVNKLCTTCPVTNCTTCLNQTFCQVCSNTTVLSNGACFVCSLTGCNQCSSNNICSSCNDAYFLNNNSCIACNYSCQTCTQSTSCTSCRSSQYRTLNTSTSQCVCNSGYFDNNYSGQCISCISVDPNSLTCSVDLSTFNYSQLVAFFGNSSWPTNILPYFTSQCAAPTFYNSTTHLCQNCTSLNCASCQNSTTCQSCNSGTILSTNGNCYVCSGSSNCLQCSGTNYCQLCNNGYTAINGSCIVCSYSCKTCNQTTSSCTSCLSSQFRILNSSSSQCECKAGYFDNNYSGQCLSCSNVDIYCLECSVDLSNFTTVQLSAFFSNSSWSTNIIPYFSCSLTSSIMNCTLNCTVCLNATSCSICDNGTVLSSNGGCYVCSGSANCIQCSGTNECQSCISSYYLLNATCQACNYSCQTCTQSTSCTSCRSSQYRTLNTSTSQCVCNSGYFDNNYSGQCISCISVDPNSLTCSVDLSTFNYSQLVAFFGNSSWPINILPYFTSQCVAPTFYNSTTHLCQNCTSLNCASCQNSTTCQSCNSGTILSTDGNCYVCSGSSNCLQCNGTNNCQKCIIGYVPINGNCVICKYSCYACISTTSCSSCLSSQYRTLNISTSQCVCNSGYFDNNYSGQCIPCISVDLNSLNCSVDLSSFNQSQLVAFFGNSSWPTNILPYFTSQCAAPTFYNSSTHLCQNCSSVNCASCQNSTTCQTCNTGTILSTNGNCYVCSGSSNCLQCSETNYCQQCIFDYIAINGSCIECSVSCLCNGYYLPIINSTCTTMCGDGIVAGLQQCQISNNNVSYGCTSDCQYQLPPVLNATVIQKSQSIQLSLQSVSYGSYAIFVLGFCLQGAQFLGHVQTYQILTMNNTLQDLKVFKTIHGFNQISQYFSNESILFFNFNFMYLATASTAIVAVVLKLLSFLCRNSRKIGVQKKTSFQNKIEDQNHSQNTEGTVDFTVHYQKKKDKIPLSNNSSQSVFLQPQNNFSKASNFIIKYPLFYLALNTLSIFSYSSLETLKNIGSTQGAMTWFYLIFFSYPIILIASLYKHIKLDSEDSQNSHFNKNKSIKFYMVLIAQRIFISGLVVGVQTYDLAIVLVLKAAIIIYFQHLKAFKEDSQFYRSSFMNFMHFALLSLLGFNRYYLSTSQENLNVLPHNTIAYLELGIISSMVLINIAFLIKKLVKKGVQVEDQEQQAKKLKQSAAKLTNGFDGIQQIDQTDINFRQNSGFNLSKHLTNYMSQKSKNKIGSTHRLPLKSNRTNQLQQNYFQTSNHTNRTHFNGYENENQQNQPYTNKQSLATQKTIKSHRIVKKQRSQLNGQNHIRFSNDCQQPDDRQTVVNYKSQKHVAKVYYDKYKQKRSQLTIKQRNHQDQSDFDRDVDLVSINYEHQGDYNRRSMGQDNQSYIQKYSKSQKQNFKKINLQHQKRKMQRQAQRQKRMQKQARTNRKQLQQQNNQYEDNNQNPNETIYKKYKRRMNRTNRKDN